MLRKAAAGALLLRHNASQLILRRYLGTEEKTSGVLVSLPMESCTHAPPDSSSAGDSQTCVQLRDFLQKSLYDSDQGYFTAARGPVPVGSVGRPLSFPQLAGEEGYRRAVREVYDTLEVSSLTWAPFVCNVLSAWLLETRMLDLHVLESAQNVLETLNCRCLILLLSIMALLSGPCLALPLLYWPSCM